MKKLFSVLLLTVLLLGATSATAFAYCGGRGMGSCAGQAQTYAVCTVEGCDQLGLHEHDGVYYHCQNYGKGLGYGLGKGCKR